MKFKQIWQKPKHPGKVIPLLDNIFSAITHGVGFGLAVTALVLLIIKAAHSGSALKVTAFTIYGASLVLLYLFSTLYHSLIYTKARKVFQIFDHSSIFLSIAGSYTPYSLVAIGGIKGWLLFGFIWLITILGILYYILAKKKNNIFEVLLYIGMGWLVIFTAPQLYATLGKTSFWLLVSGGISYTVGAFFFSMRGVPLIHTVWHLFVLAGSTLMFFSVYIGI
ncbi:PAQR family membrane homeostasis protein TrhA [Lactobacillus psittaci]|uniref:Hemolysin III n=1 Tax=Lactobacillus psittaci DSM 15354 TaxID=1122152 RepID=A0A0R1S3M6_9LACO|nr:hemolysin III family protein [Lactobacillus psittaci]KRL63580.1 hemolysin III [Lactobacillus psittaci DSM 15354]